MQPPSHSQTYWPAVQTTLTLSLARPPSPSPSPAIDPSHPTTCRPACNVYSRLLLPNSGERSTVSATVRPSPLPTAGPSSASASYLLPTPLFHSVPTVLASTRAARGISLLIFASLEPPAFFADHQRFSSHPISLGFFCLFHLTYFLPGGPTHTHIASTITNACFAPAACLHFVVARNLNPP